MIRLFKISQTFKMASGNSEDPSSPCKEIAFLTCAAFSARSIQVVHSLCRHGAVIRLFKTRTERDTHELRKRVRGPYAKG